MVDDVRADGVYRDHRSDRGRIDVFPLRQRGRLDDGAYLIYLLAGVNLLWPGGNLLPRV